MLKPVPNLLSCDEDGKVYWDGVECEYSADGLRAYTPFGAIKVALLVCSAFHGVKPKDKDLVAHWDDVPTNNKPSNLRWATTRENSMDAVRNGILKGYGKKQIVKRPNMGQGRRILSDEQIEKIQDAYWIDGRTQSDIASEFGVTQKHISRVVRREVLI